MKKCTKCGIEKPLTEFYKDKTRKEGLEYLCKFCSKQRRARYANSTEGKKQRAEYRVQNKEKLKQQQVNWYTQNKQKKKQQTAKYIADRKAEQPGCIYQIRNSTNNNTYIGQTIRGELRWKEHLSYLRGNYHENYKLQQDFNEHGEDVFEWSIIKELPKDKDQLLLQEAIEIQERINNGEDLYNLTLTIEQLKLLNENQELK